MGDDNIIRRRIDGRCVGRGSRRNQFEVRRGRTILSEYDTYLDADALAAKNRAPVAIGKIDRLFEKRRLLERDVKLKARAAWAAPCSRKRRPRLNDLKWAA
jgi:hypothetical protein